jgi:hypothetical protein
MNVGEILFSHIYISNENKLEIKSFLKKISETSFDDSKKWEKLIIDFFSKKIICPIIICRASDEDDFYLIEKEIGDIFFGQKESICNFSTNDIFQKLCVINDSLKTGTNLVRFIPWFFYWNYRFRYMFLKQTDWEDKRFQNYKGGVTIKRHKLTSAKTKNIYYENRYFLKIDDSLIFNEKLLFEKAVKSLEIKLNKFNKKSKINTKKRNPIESRLRHEVFKRDNYKCVECGNTNKEATLHCDHIISVAQGGSDELDNLQTLCQACNLAKSNRCWEGGLK